MITQKEFLFRGKPKEKDYMLFDIWKRNSKDGYVFGSLLISKGKYYICISALCRCNSYITNGVTTMIQVVPESVSEYTGIKDKNGTKIFVGDILKVLTFDKEKGSKETYWSVEYKERFTQGNGYYVYGINRRWNRALTQSTIHNCQCEVVGNTYDNPELMTANKKN